MSQHVKPLFANRERQSRPGTNVKQALLKVTGCGGSTNSNHMRKPGSLVDSYNFNSFTEDSSDSLEALNRVRSCQNDSCSTNHRHFVGRNNSNNLRPNHQKLRSEKGADRGANKVFTITPCLEYVDTSRSPVESALTEPS